MVFSVKNALRKTVQFNVRQEFSLAAQLHRLHSFRAGGDGWGNMAGQIMELYPMIHALISKKEIAATFGVTGSTLRSTGLHDEAQAGTSSGFDEPNEITAKGWKMVEAEIFRMLIAPQLIGANVAYPEKIDGLLVGIDRAMREDGATDGMSENIQRAIAGLKTRESAEGRELPIGSYLGGSVVTATSMWICRALAASANVDVEVVLHYLYKMHGAEVGLTDVQMFMSLPIPQSKVADGGVHGKTTPQDHYGNVWREDGKHPVLPYQEFKFAPAGYATYSEAVEAVERCTSRFFELLKERKMTYTYGAESAAMADQLTSNRQVLSLMSQAIADTKSTGMFITMDDAASEIYDEKTGKYYIGPDAEQFGGEQGWVTYEQKTAYDQQLHREFRRIITREDIAAQFDYRGWIHATASFGSDVGVIADDITVSAPEKVARGVAEQWATGLLDKINQALTFTRMLQAMAMAKKADWINSTSHRSGEPANQDMMSLLAVGAGAEFIKTTHGGFMGGGRGREAKYNALEAMHVKWAGRGEPLPYWGGILLGETNPSRVWVERVQQMTRDQDFTFTAYAA